MIEAELVYDKSFTARDFNTSPLTISGLDGDLYDYEPIVFLGAATVNTHFEILCNSDSTSNYRSYRMKGAASTASAAVNDLDSEMDFNDMVRTGGSSLLKCRITGASGDERYCDGLHSGGQNIIGKVSNCWKNTADKTTSITLQFTASSVADAHIMLYRTPKASEQSNWELMETDVFTARNLNTTPIDFTGLDGDQDKIYKLVLDIPTSGKSLTLTYNNDSGSNYKRQVLRNNSGSILANNATEAGTDISTSGSFTSLNSEIVLNAETGVERLTTISNGLIGTEYRQHEISMWYSNTVTNITSMKVQCNIATAHTGTAKLYRKIEPSETDDTLPFEVVKSIPLSGTNFSAGETISLLGDSINLIKVEGLLSSTSGNHEIRMQLESDTAANYPEQLLKGDTSTVSAASTTRNYIVLAKLQNGDQSEFTTYLYPRSGENRPMLTQCSYDENAIEFLGQWWADSASEITTAKIYASSSNSVTGNIKFSRLVGETPSYLANPLHFDGTNDLITMVDNSVFEFGSSDFTIAMQFTFRAEPYSYIFNRVESVSLYTQMYVQSTGLGIRMVLSSSGGTFFTLAFPSTLVSGNTYSLVIRRSGNDLNAYVDGVAGATYDVTGITFDAVSSVTEVGASTFDSRWDDFDIANWTVYNEAITLDDIAERDTLRQLEDYSPAHIAKYACALPLNDEASDPFDDISGNGLDATAVNGASLTGGTAMKFFN